MPRETARHGRMSSIPPEEASRDDEAVERSCRAPFSILRPEDTPSAQIDDAPAGRKASSSLQEFVTQHPLQDLPGRIARKARSQMQLHRSLELAELRAAMRFERRIIHAFTFLERDDGDGAFAPSLVRNADPGNLAHLRQLVDHALDLR